MPYWTKIAALSPKKSRHPVPKEEWDFCSHIYNRIFLALNCVLNFFEIPGTLHIVTDLCDALDQLKSEITVSVSDGS